MALSVSSKPVILFAHPSMEELAVRIVKHCTDKHIVQQTVPFRPFLSVCIGWIFYCLATFHI